jgi:hypothetical protein
VLLRDIPCHVDNRLRQLLFRAPPPNQKELLEIGGGPLRILPVDDADVVASPAEADQRGLLESVAVLDERALNLAKSWLRPFRLTATYLV